MRYWWRWEGEVKGIANIFKIMTYTVIHIHLVSLLWKGENLYFLQESKLRFCTRNNTKCSFISIFLWYYTFKLHENILWMIWWFFLRENILLNISSGYFNFFLYLCLLSLSLTQLFLIHDIDCGGLIFFWLSGPYPATLSLSSSTGGRRKIRWKIWWVHQIKKGR